jgi:hypothetical protein
MWLIWIIIGRVWVVSAVIPNVAVGFVNVKIVFDVLVLVGGSLISIHGFSRSAVNKEWTVYGQVGSLKDVD